MGNACCSSLFHSENANALDISPLLSTVQDITQIDQLITYIEEHLIAIEDNRPDEISNTVRLEISSTLEIRTCIKFGNDLLESVLKRVNRRTCKMCYRYKLSAATRKAVIDVLKEGGKIHWLGAGASVLGYILDQIDQINSNNSECIQLLKYMCGLAKRVKQLNDHVAEEKQMLNDVVHFIVEGSLLCLSQMQSHYLYRLFSASVDAADLQSFQAGLAHRYRDLTLVAVIGLLDRTPILSSPSQGEAPDAVGIEEQRDYVIGLLQLDAAQHSRRAVVVYGAGGVGKTTLATAVYSKLDLTSYKFCRLDMEELCSENHLKVLQEQILYDLFDQRILLRSYVEGQVKLKENFKRATQPVFMFINNALKGSDLEKLLPRDLRCLPKQTKILLTTRRLDETTMLLQQGIIERDGYCVKFLPPAQAKQLLCKKALGSTDQSFPASVDVDGLVEKCSGIPLILSLIGSNLREHIDDVSTCKELVTSLKESLTKGEGEMCERVVDVVYHSLKEPSQKEAFLDIVFFFNNCPWRVVSYVVGRDNLKALEYAGLVQVCREDDLKQNTGYPPKWNELKEFEKDMDHQTGTVKVVDAVRARGRKLSNSDRIMDDVISTYDAFYSRQKIKGIWLSDKVKCQVQAESFSSTSSSLRILHIGREVHVNGVCKQNFESLRYLIGQDFPVDVNNVKKLAFLVGNVPYDVSQLPSSLRHVELWSHSSIPAGLLESVGKLSSLEELSLNYYSRREMTLPAAFGQLQSLRFLDFSLNLTRLPDSFGNLISLEGLSLQSCPELLSLPESFGELKSLRFLKIKGGVLTELPESFGNLSALEELHLSCRQVSLPGSFGKLESLRILMLDYCDALIALPESFCNLFSLEELHLTYSPLRSLPISFGKLKSLRILNLQYCKELIELPESFADLSSLQELRLDSVSKLERIPVNFGQLTSLKSLYIIRPLCLTTLPEGFGSLSSLEYLKLDGCPKLMTLPQSFGQLIHLKELYISGSENMSTLPDQFVQLNSLERLSLMYFKSLEKLCHDFQCLISLAALVLKGCPQLEGKTIDTLVEMEKLTRLNIYGSQKLIERWEQVKDLHTLMVSRKATTRFQEEAEKKEEKKEEKKPVPMPEKKEEKKPEEKKPVPMPEKKEEEKKAKKDEKKADAPMQVLRFNRLMREKKPQQAAFKYDDGGFTEIISTALFHHKSCFLHVDIDGKLAEWSVSSFFPSEAKLAVLLTKCDLSSSWNSVALEIVKNTSAELVSQDFHVLYVQVGELREKNEQLIAQTLRLLSPGTCAWIPPDDKTRQIFAFALYKLLEKGSYGEWEPWHVAHTLIAGTTVSMAGNGGKRKVGRWKIILPHDEEGNEFEAMRDDMGSFSQLFTSF